MITVNVSELNYFIRMANKFPAIAQKYADNAIVQTIGEIARNTQPLIPVRDNILKPSFMPKFSPFQGSFGTEVKYAAAVHNIYSAGTSYKNPSKNKNAVAGFLTMGVRESTGKINDLWSKALEGLTAELNAQ